jgi:hypothetical protein
VCASASGAIAKALSAMLAATNMDLNIGSPPYCSASKTASKVQGSRRGISYAAQNETAGQSQWD